MTNWTFKDHVFQFVCLLPIFLFGRWVEKASGSLILSVITVGVLITALNWVINRAANTPQN